MAEQQSGRRSPPPLDAQDELVDKRGGARDNVVPPPEHPLREHATPHERAQPGADVRGETEPVDEFTPEGLVRPPTDPINPTQGRGGIPEHVPSPGKKR